MAHMKNAEKAQRKALKATLRNNAIQRNIKEIRKKALRAVDAKKKDEALKFYHELQQAVDKASKHNGYMKKNTAARYKSALAKKIRSIA